MNYFNKIKNILIAAAIFVPAAVSAQEVRISQGANIVANGDVKIILSETNMVNNGSFVAGSSSVLFTGTASRQRTFIGGNSRTQFYNLSVNRPFDLVQLDNDISVSGTLTMSAGNLELNNHRLDLGSTGVIIGENINASITGVRGGVIIATAILNAPARVNPGNIGLELSSQANLGSIVVTRGHVQQVNSSGQTGINRYYEIETSNNNAQVSLRFFYLEPEVAGINESELALWTGDTFMGWVATGKERNDASNNWVAKTNLEPGEEIYTRH